VPITPPGQVIVVGAGASGLVAAGRAAESGAAVLVLEKTDRPGKKILISGQTRCNLTNARELADFVAMYGANGRFLYKAFKSYFREELLAFLETYGVQTKTQDDGRVFPASDDARDVVRALERYLTDSGARLQTRVPVTGILVDARRVVGVQTSSGRHPASAVILATGGASYPATGSAGDGYRMAAAVGHSIVKLRPALVPLAVFEAELARSMQGVALSGVRVTAYQCAANEIRPSMSPAREFGRGIAGNPLRAPVIESRVGDIMMTHFGVSGPAILQMSLAVVDALEHGPVSLSIDLRPALSDDELSRDLQGEFDRHGKRSYSSILDGMLPRKLGDALVRMTGIPPDRQGHQITAKERQSLADLLKSLRFNVKGPLPLAQAMVTAGGVSLDEVDPGTMGSRLVAGLYLCGEVIDIDAETGGYNLQAAFSTGYVAGQSAAAFAAGKDPSAFTAR
jgi:hypothetical protein